MNRTVRGQLGAHRMHALYPIAQTTAAGLAAIASKWLVEARALHPDWPEADIERAAQHLRKAHFVRLSQAGVEARRKRQAKAGHGA